MPEESRRQRRAWPLLTAPLFRSTSAVPSQSPLKLQDIPAAYLEDAQVELPRLFNLILAISSLKSLELSRLDTSKVLKLSFHGNE